MEARRIAMGIARHVARFVAYGVPAVLVVVVAANASAMIAYGVGRLLGRAPGANQADADADDVGDRAERWLRHRATVGSGGSAK